jgi:uncharacterized protein
MADAVVGWQVISPEPEQTSQFLVSLFGWQVNRDNLLAYRQIQAGDGGIHGGVWPAPPGAPPFVQLFVQVQDVDECITRALRLGARVIVPKAVLPEGNAMAVLHDPLGMPLAICTAPPVR